MYPYETESEEGITLFHGDEYELSDSYGYGFGFSLKPKKLLKAVTKPIGKAAVVATKSTAKFAANAAKTAGREIGHASHTVQNAVGTVGKGIGKIPIVGAPLHAVFSMGFNIAMAPTNFAIAVAIEGRRIDKAALDGLKQRLHDFKQVAPYAQMVISVVPGIGQGVSACLSAGLALAEGQSIEEVLKAGAIGAIPGGPAIKAAATIGVESIKQVASGGRLDLQTLSRTAIGTATSALGIPAASANALVAGVATVGAIASGRPLDRALIDGAIRGLTIPDTVKKAVGDATALSNEINRVKRFDNAMLKRVEGVMANLPANNPLRDSLKTVLEKSNKLGPDKIGPLVSAALQSGISDTLVSLGAATLPEDVQKGVKAGIGLGSGLVFQQRKKGELPKVTGKLVEEGVQLAKTSPVINEARRMASTKGATQGFDVASGLLQQQVGVYDISQVRDSLDSVQKLGFDIATAARIGAVSNPKVPTLSAAADAGRAITLGMQSYMPERNAAIMKTVEENPSGIVGAKTAIKQVAKGREHWIRRLLRSLGIQE